MKSLVVYYSRTGNTRKVARDISNAMNSDIEEIIDTKKRTGPIGFMGAGKDGKGKKLTKIKEITIDPQNYDLVIIGTPIWAWNMSAPVRTYLTTYGKKFNNVAFFCTFGGNLGNTYEEMEELCSKKPVRTLSILDKDLKEGKHKDKLKKFINELKIK